MTAKRSRNQRERTPTLELIHEEIKFLSGACVRAIEALDAKAATLFGFAAVIIGICASLSPYVIEKMGATLKFFFLVGAGAMVVSAFSSILAYKMRKVALGVRVKNLPKTIKKIDNIKREDAIKKFCLEHQKCINDNNKILIDKGKKIKLSFWAGFVGILLLFISVLIGIVT